MLGLLLINRPKHPFGGVVAYALPDDGHQLINQKEARNDHSNNKQERATAIGL
jgi:hypothetical protein